MGQGDGRGWACVLVWRQADGIDSTGPPERHSNRVGGRDRGPPLTIYIDTSSIVKLYVEESGRADVRTSVDSATVIVTSQVAYPEARAALTRRRRERALSSRDFTAARSEFESDWSRFLTIPVSWAICREAGALAERYHLRGFDSIHLASFADMLRGLQGRDDVLFSSFDEKLNAAARRLARSIK